MVLVANSRNLHMRQVHQHPLCPLPWSLVNSDGTMKKTNKAAFARHLEAKVSHAESVVQPSATIIDGMSIIQKVHGENSTFAELSENILVSILQAGYESQRVDVIFDVYTDISIKTAEKENRGSRDGVLFSTIYSHTIRNWRRLLSCATSKTNLIKFFVNDWEKPENREKLGIRCFT